MINFCLMWSFTSAFSFLENLRGILVLQARSQSQQSVIEKFHPTVPIPSRNNLFRKTVIRSTIGLEFIACPIMKIYPLENMKHEQRPYFSTVYIILKDNLRSGSRCHLFASPYCFGVTCRN